MVKGQCTDRLSCRRWINRSQAGRCPSEVRWQLKIWLGWNWILFLKIILPRISPESSSEYVLDYEMECVDDYMLISKMIYLWYKCSDMQECDERWSMPFRDTLLSVPFGHGCSCWQALQSCHLLEHWIVS